MFKKYFSFIVIGLGIFAFLAYFRHSFICQNTPASKVSFPETIESLQEILSIAGNSQEKICLQGAGRSTSGKSTKFKAHIIDMSKFNKIISFDKTNKEIIVQAGITWKEIQDFIDPYDLSIGAMQSYNSFSVGGSISVNAHGQDFRQAPISKTVQSLVIMLADGTIHTIDRNNNPELFSCIVGGYGLQGVILEARLRLVDNNTLTVQTKIFPQADIMNDINAIYNNPDISLYSAHYSIDKKHFFEKILSVSYLDTHELSQDKLINRGPLYRWGEKIFFYMLRTREYFKHARLLAHEKFIQFKKTLSRNNVMRSSIEGLLYDDPTNRNILQEYFIPVKQFPAFMEKVKDILNEFAVNILNATIRIVPQNNDSLLTYSPTDTIALVIYLNLKTTSEVNACARCWTREMVEAALSCNGTFYLPYDCFATSQQVRTSYPKFEEFLRLKKKYDPQEIFINDLYITYK